jgi:phenylacetate-CoA ligase
MTVGDKLYRHLPVWAQNWSVTAYGLYWHWLRFGPGYTELVAGYRSRERLSAAAWKQWQQQQLSIVLTIAADQVPHYRTGWSEDQKRSARSGSLEDLPLLSKDPVRAAPDSFVRLDRKPRYWRFHTSGSTGTPICTIWTSQEIRDSLAVREARSANWAGVSFQLPRATFSGRMVEPRPDSPGPFHRFNRIEQQVYFSPFHLRPETARQYVSALWQHGIRWMTGYAVSYYLLAEMILEQRLTVPRLLAVITTSEKLTPAMRTVMERAYGCRVFEEYSTVENALFASECPAGRLHVSPDVAVVEILRPDGSLCGPGEPGEVVTTSLTRRHQVLVRYRLGDMATWDSALCPCGVEMPVLKEVVGRIEDVVIGPDGRQLVRFHGIFANQPNIREGQIVQEELSRIRVKVLPTAAFAEADVEEIIARVHQRLGSEVQVIVERVVAIPRTTAGKFQAVVSLLPKNPTQLDR